MSKIMYTSLSDKMKYANSADPSQSAPQEAVWLGSTLFAFSPSIFWNNLCIQTTKLVEKL